MQRLSIQHFHQSTIRPFYPQLPQALDPKILGPINTTLDTVVPARYLRVQHEITDKTGWKKVYVW
jgi:hypothetical protein